MGSGDLRVPDGRRVAVRLDPLEREGRGRPAGEAERRGAPLAHGRGPGPSAGARRQRLPVFRGVEPGGAPPRGVGPEGDGPLRPDRGHASGDRDRTGGHPAPFHQPLVARGGERLGRSVHGGGVPPVRGAGGAVPPRARAGLHHLQRAERLHPRRVPRRDHAAREKERQGKLRGVRERLPRPRRALRHDPRGREGAGVRGRGAQHGRLSARLGGFRDGRVGGQGRPRDLQHGR